jgi:recombination protein RecT
MSTALQKNPRDSFRALLEKAKPAMAQVAPAHMNPERLTRLALAATSKAPLLLQCTPASVVQALMEASLTGLEPNTSLHLASIIPRKNNKTGNMEANFQPEYRGLLKLARQSGEIGRVCVEVVREHDTFEIAYELDPPFKHKPLLNGDRGQLIGVYAYVVVNGQGGQFSFMSKAEVDYIKNKSAGGGKYGPWMDWYDEMAKKTVLKRVLKLCPMSAALANAVQIDHRGESGESFVPPEIIDVTPEVVAEDKPRGKLLAEKIAGPTSDIGDDEKAAILAAEREPGAEG